MARWWGGVTLMALEKLFPSVIAGRHLLSSISETEEIIYYKRVRDYFTERESRSGIRCSRPRA